MVVSFPLAMRWTGQKQLKREGVTAGISKPHELESSGHTHLQSQRQGCARVADQLTLSCLGNDAAPSG